jgi:thymidine kinase
MFAGKSEELLRRINCFKYADISYLIFKPKIDVRSKNLIKSRDGRHISAIEVSTSNDIWEYVTKHKNIDAIAIDEAQFFDKNLGIVCNKLADKGYVVYVAGLDLDFKGEPFEGIASTLAYADKVTKLTAICTVCGAEATRTQRLINGKPASKTDNLIKIGDNEFYESRCRQHYKLKD